MVTTIRTKTVIQKELTAARERLELYLEQEKRMLTGGVQLYTVGSRNLQRYNTPLSEIRAEIESLKDEIESLEAELAGASARRAVAVAPRDW